MEKPVQLGEASADLRLRAREAETLLANGFETLAALRDHFPKRYEDRRQFDAFPAQPGGLPVCLYGRVIDTQRRQFGGKGGFFEAVVEEAGGMGIGRVTCRWFNMPFMQKVIAAGQEVVLFGKPKESAGRVVIDHPEFEVMESHSGFESWHLDRLVPIYPGVAGINQRRWREIILAAVEVLAADGLEGSTAEIQTNYQRIHLPDTMAEVTEARRFFAMREFVAVQRRLLQSRETFKDQPGVEQGRTAKLFRKFYEDLPFDLTGAQKRTIKEIREDLRSPRPMSRLLQGDVGSGKTLVAIAAILLAVESGGQAAFMAPTQILAEQHFATCQQLLEPLGISVGLATGDRKENLAESQLLVGTHALLFDGVTFENLTLAVVDEQHKFGVQQRARLAQRGHMPDVLVMTATPIPRTLTLTIYGDLDVSILDEKPVGRKKIATGVRVRPKVSDITKFVKARVAEDERAYLVFPLVEEGTSGRGTSVVTEHPKWQKRLGKIGVGLLHGKMPPREKEEVMDRFRAGVDQVLCATTVIEVGVDVPEATVMVIFDADRFGLSQLHQLRGRIGRGGRKSWCVLVTDGKNPVGLEKLQVLAKSEDGFEIAEADLQLRGPGEVMGLSQSGQGALQFPEFLSDYEFVREARAKALKLEKGGE